MIRAVLDTNVVVSAMLFTGPPSQLVSAWQSGRLHPIVSSDILDEYVRVLAYPKFKLTSVEICQLLEEELLPFIETIRVDPFEVGSLRDPDDAKFVHCALGGQIRWLVSGDADLLELRRVKSVQIVPVTTFLEYLKRTP